MSNIKQIAFVEADKYVVAKPYYGLAPFKPPQTFKTSYGTFYDTGDYVINAGFLFSANFPAINTFETRRAACVHDFYYCLMKDGHLDRSYRDDADYLLHTMLIEDGVNPIRAAWWLTAVRIGGDKALNSPAPKVQYSPSADEVPDINRHVGLV